MIRFLRSGLSTGRRYFSTSEPTTRNETSVFFESVTSTVKGYMNPNYIVEHNSALTAAEK